MVIGIGCGIALVVFVPGSCGAAAAHLLREDLLHALGSLAEDQNLIEVQFLLMCNLLLYPKVK